MPYPQLGLNVARTKTLRTLFELISWIMCRKKVYIAVSEHWASTTKLEDLCKVDA